MSSKYTNVIKSQLDVLGSGFLDDIGTDPIEVVFDNQIQEALFIFGEQLIKDILKSIEDNDLNASRNLSQSVDSPLPIRQANGHYLLKVVMADYWEWAESGRRDGKLPPVQNIMDWISNKGIKVKSVKGKGVLHEKKRMAFAIRASIGKKGTIKRFNYKGSRFLSDVVNDEAMKDFGRGLAEILGKTVAVSFAVAFNPKYNKSA